MKLSDNTINILKNFSTINKSIEINPGNEIKTISPSKTIFSKAVVEENFTTNFAIFELPKFLGSLSLFSDPELTFSEKYVTISQGNQKIRYTFCEPSTIVVAPSKNLVLPDLLISFSITADQINSINKSLSVLSLPEICIFADGENVYISAANSKNPDADEYSIKLAETDKTFKYFFNRENFKIIETSYTFNLSEKGLLEVVSENLKYFIMGEAK